MQSVFYNFVQATRLDGLLGVQVSGLIIWALYNVALFQVGSSLSNIIIWVLRVCSVMYLGLVVHAEVPARLCDGLLVPWRLLLLHTHAVVQPHVPAATVRRCTCLRQVYRIPSQQHHHPHLSHWQCCIIFHLGEMCCVRTLSYSLTPHGFSESFSIGATAPEA